MLRDSVRSVLDSLLEGEGLVEVIHGDFEVALGEAPVWVRVHESPGAVSIYRQVGDDMPLSPELSDKIQNLNIRFVVFRVIWEDESVFLRADLPAKPFSSDHLQYVLETFDAEAESLTSELAEWKA